MDGLFSLKWMVYFMENPIKMDDLGVPLFLETLLKVKLLVRVTNVKSHDQLRLFGNKAIT